MLAKRRKLSIVVIVLVLLLGVMSQVGMAQTTIARLQITGIDANSLPNVDVTFYGQDSNGVPINPEGQLIDIKHNGIAVSADKIKVKGKLPTGTFTVFLLDLATGMEDQLPALRQTVESYAAIPYMEEQLDFAAIYRTDQLSAIEILPPTGFHNEIRNRFEVGLEKDVQSGPTALGDSLGDLLNRIESLRPRPEMMTSIIIISDGTDIVSKQFPFDKLELLGNLATQKGVMLNSIWLPNSFTTDKGKQNLQALSALAGGGYTELSNTAQQTNLWQHISTFRNHQVISYEIPELKAGKATIQLTLPNLAGAPTNQSETTLPESLSSLVLEIPEDARTLILSNPESPTNLKLKAKLTWLDGKVRNLKSANLFVNQKFIAAFDPINLADFTLPLPLNEGENLVQLTVNDVDGTQAQSSPIILKVQKGEKDSIPTVLQARNSSWVNSVLIGLVVLGVTGIGVVLFKFGTPLLAAIRGRFNRTEDENEEVEEYIGQSKPPAVVPSMRYQPAEPTVASGAVKIEKLSEQQTVVPPARPDSADQTIPHIPVPGQMMATIEVVESVSKIQTNHPISRGEFLIGRSPTVDLSFPNDPTISRIHATIVRDGNIYRIYDEQSTSGSYVNDQVVPEYGLQLADRDEIHLGAVHLRFRQFRA